MLTQAWTRYIKNKRRTCQPCALATKERRGLMTCIIKANNNNNNIEALQNSWRRTNSASLQKLRQLRPKSYKECKMKLGN